MNLDGRLPQTITVMSVRSVRLGPSEALGLDPPKLEVSDADFIGRN